MQILKTAGHDAGHPERPLVIAYYTEGTPYEGEAEVLKLSLESVGYSYEVCAVPNLGSWQKNTQYKALFIWDRMNIHSGKPLLYLDVDAVMVKPPYLLDDMDADIAAVHFANQNELLSGTLYLANTPGCREVVKRWININIKHPETLPNGKEAWDQRTLEMAIKQTPSAKYVELPQEYTWIVELTQRRVRDAGPPVIMHTRGAKRFKNQIDGKKGYAR